MKIYGGETDVEIYRDVMDVVAMATHFYIENFHIRIFVQFNSAIQFSLEHGKWCYMDQWIILSLYPSFSAVWTRHVYSNMKTFTMI